MLASLLLPFLIATTLVLSMIEYRLYKTALTPFTLFSIPYIVIVTYQMFIIQAYGWEPVSTLFLVYIFLFLVSFFIAGTVSIAFFEGVAKSHSKMVPKKKESLLKRNKELKLLEKLFLITATYLLVFFAVNFNSLSVAGMVVQEEFQTLYSSGLNYYLRLICMIGAVYFWGHLNKNRKVFFLLGLVCFLPNFLTFVKGIAFLLIIGGLVANILINERKLKLKTIIFGTFSGISTFFLTYMIEIGIWNPDRLLKSETYSFIFAKLNAYLVSGVQSFNVNISNQQLFENIQNPVYAPAANLLAKFGLTDRIDTINNVFISLGFIPNYGEVTVNTNTYIGTILLYCGLGLGLLVNALIAFAIYYFFYSAIKTKDTLKIIRYSIFSAGLILAWFDYFYMQIFWFYLAAIFALLPIVSKIKYKTIRFKKVVIR